MYQVGNACYDTALMANQAVASTLGSTIVQVDAVPYVVTITEVTDTSMTYVLERLTGRGNYVKNVVAVPQPCNLLQASDAVTLGWGVVAAWIAAFCIIYIARVFRDGVNTQNDHGNT